jgi:hypothetical protein
MERKPPHPDTSSVCSRGQAATASKVALGDPDSESCTDPLLELLVRARAGLAAGHPVCPATGHPVCLDEQLQRFLDAHLPRYLDRAVIDAHLLSHELEYKIVDRISCLCRELLGTGLLHRVQEVAAPADLARGLCLWRVELVGATGVREASLLLLSGG